jgi:hypothetical protein
MELWTLLHPNVTMECRAAAPDSRHDTTPTVVSDSHSTIKSWLQGGHPHLLQTFIFL